jgi:hypothetical protein
MALSKSKNILLGGVSHDEEIAGFKRFIRLTGDCHVASLLAMTFIYFTANTVSTSLTIVKNKKRNGI